VFQIAKVRLFYSEDQGKSWRLAKESAPTKDAVRFSAPRDGLYWFALQVIWKDGSKKPPALRDLLPAWKVYVRTTANGVERPAATGEHEPAEDNLREKVEQHRAR
jgi:hypothetical protein